MKMNGNVQVAPLISVIIPAFNEAGAVNATISHLRGIQQDAALEIIVVDGEPRGSTIRTIHDEKVIRMASAKGRARQMNRGAEHASGEILVFLHADTILPSRAFEKLLDAVQNNGYAAGAFDLGIGSRKRIFRITEGYVALRTRLTRVPFGDQAIFIRRDYFDRIGGFRDIPLMEDVELMKRIKKRGDRICIIPDKVITSARRWEREGVLRCTLRNWALQICYSVGVSPDVLAKWYKQ